MAVTESVKIVFEVDDKALVSTVQQLQAVGKVSQEDAAKFNALTAASKAAGSSLEGASKGAEKFAVASKDIAKSTNEVAKSTAELKTVAPSIGEAGVQANIASEDFVSLRERLREAKLEVQRLGEQFNNSGPEFEAAVARAGELADEFDDLNRQVRLSNPEGKIQAFQNLGQGIVGAFSVATGALQAFGAENEQVQQIAQKLQGALNIAQGIQSIVGLKEAYDDVKVVLGFTTAAQNTLTTATTAGAAATGTAATATRGFAAALTSTGIGAIVVAIGALVGAMMLLGDETDETSKKSARLLELEAERKRLAGDAINSARALAVARGQLSEIDARRAEQEERDNDLIRQKSEELAKLQPKYQILRKQLDQFIAGGGTAEEFFGARTEEARTVIQGYDEIQGQLTEIRKNAVNQQLIFNEEEKKANQDKNQKELEDNKRKLKEQQDQEAAAAEARKQAKLKALDDELAALQEAQRGALIGVDDELQRIAITDSFREKITAKQIERAKIAAESITLIEQKAANDQLESFQAFADAVEALRDKDVADAEKAAADKLAAEQKLLQEKKALLGQEEALALLRNQVNATDATDLAEKNFKTQEQFLIKRIELEKAGSLEQQKLLAELDLLYKNYEKDKTKTAEDEEAKRSAIAQEAFDLFFELNRQSFEREAIELEKQREKGLITEEEYENKVLELRKRKAVADKNAAIFGATLGLAEAIIKALNAPPPVSFASVALASAIAAANLAKIIATPLPKFKQGTLSVPGRDTGDDSVMAMLRPDEAVIPTETNREYRKSIRAIFRRSVDSKELNEFVENKEAQSVMKAIYSRNVTAKELNEFIINRESNKSKQDEVISDKDIQHIIESVLIKNKQSNLSKYSEVINDKSIQSIVRSFYLQKFTSDELSEIVKNEKFNINNFDELINDQTIKSIIKSEIVNNNKSNFFKYNEIVNNKDIQSIVKMLYSRKSTLKELSEFINNKHLNITEYNELINDRDVQTIMRSIYSRKSTSKELNEFVESRKALKTVQQINDKTKTVKLNNVELEEPIFKFNPITLDAMFKRDLRVSQINSAVQRSSGGAIPTINVKADVDTYALSKAMAKNKTMEVGNVESIGEAVAEALSKRTNRRQQI